MGKLSSCIAQSAQDAGAELHTETDVTRIRTEGNKVVGVDLNQNGERLSINAKVVMANCNPYHLFSSLLEGKLMVPRSLPSSLTEHVKIDRISRSNTS